MAALWVSTLIGVPHLLVCSITAVLSDPAILSTSLRVTISSMRHGGGATLQIA